VEDEKHPGHPVTMQTHENVKKEMALVRTDCCLGNRMTAEELNMDEEMTKQILT
jgi:hypothetical protein